MTSPQQREPAAAHPVTQVPPRSRWGQPVRLALGTASALGLARFAYGPILPAMRIELGWNLAQDPDLRYELRVPPDYDAGGFGGSCRIVGLALDRDRGVIQRVPSDDRRLEVAGAMRGRDCCLEA